MRQCQAAEVGDKQSVTDRAITLGYKVQRKIRRELRKRCTPSLVRADLRQMRRQIASGAAKEHLLEYAKVAGRDWPDSVEAWLDPAEVDAVVAKAEEAVAHRFDLLGSGLVDTGDPIDWHRDLKTGFRWPEQTHHLDIVWDAVPAGTDIKMPWELSRCQHFVVLGLAWRATGERTYYEAFKNQLKGWITANPCGFGVNWVCAMDVAIRAVNWLTAMALFAGEVAEDEDEGFFESVLSSLWLHGRHICRNLEWQGPRSASLANHFLADICGLLGLGALFRKSGRGREWLGLSSRWLEREVVRQVFSDGSNFETSTSYHRLSTEMFLWAEGLARGLGKPFESRYRERLAGMVDFVVAYSSPSGRAAQFGDNDGGRFLTAGIGDPADHRYLVPKGAGFGARANRWLLGGSCEPTDGHRNRFPDGGYAFAGVGEGWMGVRAGEVSHGGAHAHADQLHFVLSVGGHEVVVDPGTGVYSADVAKRNAYRSTAAHNGPCVNGWEANRFADGTAGLFRMSDDTRSEVPRWVVGPERAEFHGVHHGFTRLREGCTCSRRLELVPGALVVTDEVSGLKSGDVLGWNMRLAPGVRAVVVEDGARLEIGERMLWLRIDFAASIEVVASTFSPNYGIEQDCLELRVRRLIDQSGAVGGRIVLDWSHDGKEDF